MNFNIALLSTNLLGIFIGVFVYFVYIFVHTLIFKHANLGTNFSQMGYLSKTFASIPPGGPIGLYLIPVLTGVTKAIVCTILSWCI